MNRSAKRTALAALVVAGLALSGCTGSDGGDAAGGATSEATGATGAAPPVADEDAARDAAGGGDTAAGPALLGRVDPASSAVVRTADLAVRVDDVRAAADTAGRLVREAGGLVAGEQADAPSDGEDGEGGRAELRLRVPTERFDELLGRLAGLGEERHRTVGAEEVGDQVVDLESRLATQRASVARVQALLDEAQNLGEVVQLEAELTRRIADLESLTARLDSLRDRVALATIVLRLDTEPVALAADAGFLDGLRAGWDALVASSRAIAVVTGAVLPFVPLLLVAGLVALRLRKRSVNSPA